MWDRRRPVGPEKEPENGPEVRVVGPDAAAAPRVDLRVELLGRVSVLGRENLGPSRFPCGRCKFCVRATIGSYITSPSPSVLHQLIPLLAALVHPCIASYLVKHLSSSPIVTWHVRAHLLLTRNVRTPCHLPDWAIGVVFSCHHNCK